MSNGKDKKKLTRAQKQKLKVKQDTVSRAKKSGLVKVSAEQARKLGRGVSELSSKSGAIARASIRTGTDRSKAAKTPVLKNSKDSRVQPRKISSTKRKTATKSNGLSRSARKLAPRKKK
jgi:hypothetical protein